ncbi:Metallo-dependent hydrolase [Marasmius fiardii PR-910]|nr:Metallo-dependent hydrolase [Marasmius fiardii PR-910]
MVAHNILNSHVIDVHCHPTDSDIPTESIEALEIRICAMSTRREDQPLVRSLALSYPDKVIPCFGYHPWFTHRISLESVASSKENHYRTLFLPKDENESKVLDELLESLPDPITIDDVLVDLRRNLEDFPNAMLGEVGLDRSFRIAYDYFASPRKLTPFTIPLDHQLAILKAQIDVAIELRRNISLHSVKSHKATMDLLSSLQAKYGEKWTRISLDMHSCGFSPTMWKEIERKYSNVFLSLSTVINSRSPNHSALIEVCSPDRILVESDYNHISMCTKRTWDMLRTVADIKGWSIETEWVEDVAESDWGAIRMLERNWKRFQLGNHAPIVGRKKKKAAEDWMSDDTDQS